MILPSYLEKRESVFGVRGLQLVRERLWARIIARLEAFVFQLFFFEVIG
jgi:hypothetical protein